MRMIDNSSLLFRKCRLASWYMRILLPAALLSACSSVPLQPSQPAPVARPAPVTASPQQETLLALAAFQGRLDRVSGPLLVSNATLCRGHARKLLGFSAKNKYSYSEELAQAVQATFGFGERLQVTNVLAGSGAARAGIRRGDILIAAGDKEIPQGPNAERQTAAILTPMVQGRTDIKLTVSRDNANIALDVPLTPSCGFSIELGNADHVNAYGDGRRIAVTRGMLNFAQTDDEVAYVIAKEMAHNIFGHAAKQRMQATMNGIIDNLVRVNPDLDTMTGTAGVIPYSLEFDSEADRLALYMVARAGYRTDQASAFWQRLASQYPASVLNGHTAIHPATAARLSAISKAAAEIRSKQAAKRPLVP